MKVIAFLLAASLFMSTPAVVEKAERLNDYALDAINLMQLWSEGKVKGSAVDKSLLKVISTEVPEELEPYKLIVLRWLFQYEFALEMGRSDPYTSLVMLNYLSVKTVVYKALLNAYLQGLDQRGGKR